MPRPFHCGSQYADWTDFNCAQCLKGSCHEDPPPPRCKCDLEQALLEACFGDGSVTDAIAGRMGYLDHSPPHQAGYSYNWRCPEFVKRED